MGTTKHSTAVDSAAPQLSTGKPALASLGARLKVALDRLGGVDAVADTQGLPSASSLRRYIKGDRAPDFEVVASIARLSGIDLRWFEDGVERPAASVDLAALEAAIRDVEGVCCELKVGLTPESRARVIYLAYEWKVRGETPAEPGVLRNLVELAASAK